jgi:hypothetical protein
MALDVECCFAEWRYAECRDFLIIMLNVVMLSVIMLSVIMLSVIMLSVFMLNVVAPFPAKGNENTSAYRWITKNIFSKIPRDLVIGH